jgi:hypothetical protein
VPGLGLRDAAWDDGGQIGHDGKQPESDASLAGDAVHTLDDGPTGDGNGSECDPWPVGNAGHTCDDGPTGNGDGSESDSPPDGDPEGDGDAGTAPCWLRGPVWQKTPVPGTTRFGFSVASAGDVNADGYFDVVVGAYAWSGQDSYEGRVYGYWGGPDGLGDHPDWVVDPTDQYRAYFGFSVASAGDVNGDGYDDVVIGAVEADNDAVDEGAAYLYLGSALGLDTDPVWSADPTDNEGARFGRSVAGVGDINGDGFDDVLVGAYTYTVDADARGRVYLYLGNAQGIDANFAWYAEPAEDGQALFGGQVAGAGDVNRDGFADVIVGAPFWSGGGVHKEGRAYLFTGGPDGLSATPDWVADPTDRSDSRFGGSVARAGDVNGDGYDDVVVGAYGVSSYRGGAYTYLGGPTGLQSDPIWSVEPLDPLAYFGAEVAPAGDLNGDGFDDVAVGAFNWSSDIRAEGRVVVFAGTETGLDELPVWFTHPTDQDFARFGASLAAANDVNGDGCGDLIVGAWAWVDGPGNDYGRAYLYYGCW